MSERMRIQRKREKATAIPSIQNDILQRSSTVPDQAVDEVPPIVQEVLSSSGQPLDAAAREFMEPRFGHDFSQVRVHTDERAAESAQSVNALAYTVGQDVVFGQGQYTPETSEGKGLLAHELTHVVQQGPGKTTLSGINSPGDPHEHEAESVSSAVLQGQEASMQLQNAPSFLQRQEDLSLTPPSLIAPRQEQYSLFPPGQEPHLHLDLPNPYDLLTYPGVAVNPVGPPRWIASPLSAPNARDEDEPDKIWELDFDIKTGPTSPEGRKRIDLGLSLESGAEQAQVKGELLHTIISGKDAQDTPLGLQLLNAGFNIGVALLSKTPGGNALMEKLFLDKLTFVINPTTGTYGATVQFKLP